MSKRGLPSGLRMRHDAHYVDELAQHRPTPVGRLIALDKLDPNPEQPRVEIGNLEDLTSSIKEKGVLEPLLVKPSGLGGRWMIIAGERRWRAAREAGLREVPCIEMDVDDRAVAEIALIENMQRKDLTPWEEADGLKALCERFNYTHEEVARKVGKSRSTVTEALSIAAIPEAVRERCRRADIATKSLLLEIVRQPDERAMAQMADEIIARGMTRDDARATRRAQGSAGAEKAAAKPYVFRFSPPKKEFKLELRFRRSKASTEDVLAALKLAIEELAEENGASTGSGSPSSED
ncbi:MAG TPA: ParB/RepB/Spo0J family partition protein [Pyrinomonadaceae bacterium]